MTLAPGHRGRGLARETLAAAVATLFDHRGDTSVHRLLAGLGFRCEARLVEADWFKGEWTTLRVYAVLRREWEARRLLRS